jgi:hypothetical protein
MPAKERKLGGASLQHSISTVLIWPLVFGVGSVLFSHILRKANKMVHELSRMCFIDKINCNWDNEPLAFLLSSLINDVTVINN